MKVKDKVLVEGIVDLEPTSDEEGEEFVRINERPTGLDKQK
jgi:hypothetical protein